MKIKDPQITLADEARNGVKEEVRSGFLVWLFEFNVSGDDGELYALGGSILSLALEKIDLATLCMAKGTGTVLALFWKWTTVSIRFRGPSWMYWPMEWRSAVYSTEAGKIPIPFLPSLSP